MWFKKSSIPASLVTLANAIEARDPYTAGHTWRVSRYALAMARGLKLPQREIERIEVGALLHDVGKIAIADRVLHKPDRLTDVEFAMMQSHPLAGVKMLANESVYDRFRDIIQHHHERVDGKGYPDGLKGGAISEGARILAVADTFDAMTSHRPYRKALSAEVALQELDRQRGTQFDARMVDSFLQQWETGAVAGVVLHSAQGFALERCPDHGETIAVDPVARLWRDSGCPVCVLALNGLL